MTTAKPKLSYERLRDKTITYLRERGDCMWVDLKLTGSPMLVMKRAAYDTIEVLHPPTSFQPYERRENVVTPQVFIIQFCPGWPDKDEALLEHFGIIHLRPKDLEEVRVCLAESKALNAKS